MADEQLELRWSPVAADWTDALRAVTPLYRWAPWFSLALAAFGTVLVLADQPYAGVFGLACAGVIAVMPMIGVSLSFRRNPVAASTVTATVDEHSLRMMTIDGTAYSDLRWSGLAGWLETKRCFVLRAGESTSSPMYPVPLRAFGGPDEQQMFRELLRRHVGSAEQS